MLNANAREVINDNGVLNGYVVLNNVLDSQSVASGIKEMTGLFRNKNDQTYVYGTSKMINFSDEGNGCFRALIEEEGMDNVEVLLIIKNDVIEFDMLRIVSIADSLLLYPYVLGIVLPLNKNDTEFLVSSQMYVNFFGLNGQNYGQGLLNIIEEEDDGTLKAVIDDDNIVYYLKIMEDGTVSFKAVFIVIEKMFTLDTQALDARAITFWENEFERVDAKLPKDFFSIIRRKVAGGPTFSSSLWRTIGKETASAYNVIRKVGVDNISLDEEDAYVVLLTAIDYGKVSSTNCVHVLFKKPNVESIYQIIAGRDELNGDLLYINDFGEVSPTHVLMDNRLYEAYLFDKQY